MEDVPRGQQPELTAEMLQQEVCEQHKTDAMVHADGVLL
jgi:hypothetical protein